MGLRQVRYLRDVGRPGGDCQDEDAEQEGDVPRLGGDERLDGRVRVLLLLPPVSDQEVRADPHQLPPDQELEEIVRNDQVEHGGGEQGQCSEVPCVAPVAVHVGGRIDLHEERHQGDDHEHHGRQTVHVLPDLEPEATELEVSHRARDRRSSPDEVGPDADRDHEAREHGPDPDLRSSPRHPLAEEDDEEEGHRWERRDEPGESLHA